MILQILAVFESSAHHLYTPERERQSLILLDHIVRALGLTFLDNNEPEVSAFTPNAVPVAHKRSYDGMSKESLRSPRSSSRKCGCIPSSPNASMATDRFSSSWSYAPPWDPTWTAEEMHKEACRRLCWSALNLVASYTSHCIAFRKEPTDLYLTDPANVSLLFVLNWLISTGWINDLFCLVPVVVPGRGIRAKLRRPQDAIAKGLNMGALLPQHASVEFLYDPPTEKRVLEGKHV